MSKYFQTSSTPIVDYGKHLPLEAIMAGLQAKQTAFDDYSSLIEEYEDQIANISYLDGPYGELLGDKEAGQNLIEEYRSLIEEGVKEIGGDYSKARGLTNKLKSRVRKDFSRDGLGYALEARQAQAAKELETLAERLEKNNVSESDLSYWGMNLNPLGEEGNYNQLGAPTISDRPDLNQAIMEFIKAYPDKENTYFKKGSGPTSGYIVKENVKVKEFMEDLKPYFYNIPGAKEAMQRDLFVAKNNPESAKLLTESATNMRLKYVNNIEESLDELETIKKDPKAFGYTKEEIASAEANLLEQKSSFNDPQDSNYKDDDYLIEDYYVMGKLAPYSGFEYTNIEKSITQDWRARELFRDQLERKRKTDQDLDDARNIFMGPGAINSVEMERIINKLPETINTTRKDLENSKYEMGNFMQSAIQQYSDTPINYSTVEGTKAAKATKVYLENLFDGYEQAQKNGTAGEFINSLNEKDKNFLSDNYNPYLLNREKIANQHAQLLNAEEIMENAVDKDKLMSSNKFNSLYESYEDRFYHYNMDAGRKASKNRLTKNEYYDWLYLGKLPSRVNTEDDKHMKPLNNIDSEVPNPYDYTDKDDSGLSNTLAWSKNLDQTIITPIENYINTAGLSGLETVLGENAQILIDNHFGSSKNIEYKILPVVGPSVRFNNAFQLTATDPEGKKDPIPLTIDAGEMNKQMFVDMFNNMMSSGLQKGDQPMIDHAAMGIFQNTFASQLNYTLAKAAEGAPIELNVGENNIILEPTSNNMYKIGITDSENQVAGQERKINYMEIPGSPGIELKADLNQSMIEIGKVLYNLK